MKPMIAGIVVCAGALVGLTTGHIRALAHDDDTIGSAPGALAAAEMAVPAVSDLRTVARLCDRAWVEAPVGCG